MNTNSQSPKDDLDSRLRSLDTRASRNRKTREEKGSSKSDSAGFGNGLRLSSEFVSAILVGTGIGYGIDYLAGTSPLGMIIFLLLGFVSGVLNMLRAAERMSRSKDTDRE